MRKIKLCTYVDRGGYFLDKFIQHYNRYFSRKEFLFLFEKTTDFDLYKYFYPFIKHPYEIRDISADKSSRNESLNAICNQIQKETLAENDVFIFVDIDELIYHPNLREVLETFDTDYLTPRGYDIIQSHEPPLMFNKPILEQRNYWMRDTWYDKPIITRKYLEYDTGKHNRLAAKNYFDDLILIHLNRVDYQYHIDQNIEMIKLYGGPDLNGIHERFHSWFETFEPLKELIPQHIKEIKWI